jgi:hypothetical protein
LSGLEKTASTSRVLNLAAIASQQAGDPDYDQAPFFRAATLNGAVIIKHRLRADEAYIFERQKRISTKVIIPFERTDLSLGGRSLFVGQRGWIELLNQLRGTAEDETRDVALLEALDELPSLDPFLLREHLRRRDFKIANCYFAISQGDLERMQRFVSSEISKLVDLAYGGSGVTAGGNISKLVSLLLSGQDDRRLEPLRLTLGLEGANFREGVFSWKGFLYYKWVLATLWPQLREVLGELTEIKVVGPRDDEMLRHPDPGAPGAQNAAGLRRRVRRADPAEQSDGVPRLPDEVAGDVPVARRTDWHGQPHRQFLALSVPEGPWPADRTGRAVRHPAGLPPRPGRGRPFQGQAVRHPDGRRRLAPGPGRRGLKRRSFPCWKAAARAAPCAIG